MAFIEKIRFRTIACGFISKRLYFLAALFPNSKTSMTALLPKRRFYFLAALFPGGVVHVRRRYLKALISIGCVNLHVLLLFHPNL